MNVLKIINKSMTEHKRAPMESFESARKNKEAVYIFNNSQVAGVVLTQEQYEKMHEMIVSMKNEINELKSISSQKEKKNVQSSN